MIPVWQYVFICVAMFCSWPGLWELLVGLWLEAGGLGLSLGCRMLSYPKRWFLCVCYICSKQHSQSGIQERLQARQLVAHVISHSLNSSLEPGLTAYGKLISLTAMGS